MDGGKDVGRDGEREGDGEGAEIVNTNTANDINVLVLKPRKTKKLSTLWRVPYTVIDRAGPVNYCIQLIGSTTTIILH